MLDQLLTNLGPIAIPVQVIGQQLGDLINDAIDKLIPPTQQ